MNPRIFSASLVTFLLASPLAMLQAGGEAPTDNPDLTRAKPSAPVELRWLQDGRDGVVEVEVTASVDHDGLDLMLVVPGAGQQGARSLPAAGAGQAGTVSWDLGAAPSAPPRVMVVIRRAETRQPRSFVADWQSTQDLALSDGQAGPRGAGGKNARVSGESGVARAESAPPENGIPEIAESESKALESMPAQETLKHGQPGEIHDGD